MPTYLLETVPVLLVGRELGQQLQILEVVEALEHRAQQQLYTQRGTFKGPGHEVNNFLEGLKNQISTFCIGADGLLTCLQLNCLRKILLSSCLLL